jgi:hypothetical protein
VTYFPFNGDSRVFLSFFFNVTVHEAYINHPGWEIGLPVQSPWSKRTADQFYEIGRLHMSAEGTQKIIASDRTPENSAGKKQRIAFHPQAIQHPTRQDSRVDVTALEPFVPISVVVNNPAVDVLLP